MTRLRKLMLDEHQRRNYAHGAVHEVLGGGNEAIPAGWDVTACVHRNGRSLAKPSDG